MAARRAQGPQKPQTPFILTGAVALTGYGIYMGYPGLAAIWLAVIVCAWTYPPAAFSGKKDSRGYPTAGSPGETAAMGKYRFWEDLKFKMIMPNGDWFPGIKPLLSWFVAVWAGAGAYFIPVTDEYTTGFGQWINAGAAFIVIAQVTASRRRNQVAGDENPGARIDSLIRLFKKNRPQVLALSIGGLAVGALIGTVVTVIVPWATERAELEPIPVAVLWALSISIGPLMLLAKPWITEALEHWLIVVAARGEWDNRWLMLKQDPAPRLIDRRTIGPATIDTFDAPPASGAMAFFQLAPKIGPTMGAASKFAVLSTESVDSQNQPVPGTRHPLRFEISDWPSDQFPDVHDPETPQDVINEFVRASLVWAADDAGAARPILDQVKLLTSHGGGKEGEKTVPTPAVWEVTWFAPEGPPASYIRSSLKDSVAGVLNAETLVDHRAGNGRGAMYTGALTDDNTVWNPASGINTKAMTDLADEDMWDGRWIEVMKMGTNPPVIQSVTAAEAKLATGNVTINTVSFVTRQGMPPGDFFAFEPKLPTVMGAAPFVNLTGFAGKGRRPGERHSQAFSIFWSDKPVPSKPDELAPVPRSKGPEWVLAGRINQAFKQARLPDRPEIINATCLTKPESRGHIWKIDLRLYGGVTLPDVRGALQKIKGAWGSEWVRVTAAKDGCTIVAGANPSKVKLAEPRHEQYLADLDWEQAFLDAKISGIGGQLPKLVKVSHMPLNKQVKILEFDLANTGLDFARIKESRGTLESTSGNSFVEIRRVKNSATRIIILASEVSPMPEHAPYDYKAIDVAKGIPFATGVEGEPIEFNLKDHIHLMVVGGSGSGKSVILQALIAGAFARGCDLYIADPTKGAADFTFAEPYAKAFCKDLINTGAMMKGVYDEVKRRVALNTKHGVGSYRDLPEDVRPRHIVLVLDEFTSMISPDAVAKPSDDPEIEAERDMAMTINGSKAEIGAFTAKVAREARSAGVTLLLATQKLTAKDLDQMPGGSSLKVNLSRLIAGKSTQGERMSALKDPMSAPVMGESTPPGRAIFEPVTSGPVLIQCWYDKEEQEALFRYVGTKREALTEGEKMDLSKYRRRTAEDREAARVVELDDIELDMGDLELDDLELSMDDLEMEVEGDGADNAAAEEEDDKTAVIVADAIFDAPAPTEPEAPLEMEPMSTSLINDQVTATIDVETVLLLDIDGNLFPFTQGDGMQTITVPGSGTFNYRPEVIDAVNRTPARQMTVSSWDERSSLQLKHLLPRVEGALQGSSEEYGWWKIDAVVEFLRTNPQIKRVIWADDELADEDPMLGIPMLDIAHDALAGVKSLLLAPDPYRGLAKEHFDQIADFLGQPGWLAPIAESVPEAAEATEPSNDKWADLVIEDLDTAPAPALVTDEPDFDEPLEIITPTPPPSPEESMTAFTDDEPFDQPAAAGLTEPMIDEPLDEPAPVKKVTPPAPPAKAAFNDDELFGVPAPTRPVRPAVKTAPKKAPIVDGGDLFGETEPARPAQTKPRPKPVKANFDDDELFGAPAPTRPTRPAAKKPVETIVDGDELFDAPAPAPATARPVFIDEDDIF